MSESCNSRQFSWLVKSCFPNPQQDIHHHNHRGTTTAAADKTSPDHHTFSSLPDDLLLECLSRVTHSSLPSLSRVCRRWAHLLQSSAFYQLRRIHGPIHHTLYAVSVSDTALHASRHRIGRDAYWITASCTAQDLLRFHHMFYHARVSAIGRHIYIIGLTEMLRSDTWTGTVTVRSGTLFPRKKFAAAVVASKIYVCGGHSRSLAVEEYNPETDEWRVVSDAPRKRYGCIGASTDDGLFYVIGGLKICVPSDTKADAHSYERSMDVYDVAARVWLESISVPESGCVVAACAAEGHIYVLMSNLSFWKMEARRKSGGFGEWCKVKSPPLPAQFRMDGTVRFGCVGVGDKVVMVQVKGCIDDLLRCCRRSIRGLKERLVFVYDCAAREWSREANLPEVMRRATCVCVEW